MKTALLALPVVATFVVPTFAVPAFAQQEDLSSQLLTVKRVYVDRLTGGETTAAAAA